MAPNPLAPIWRYLRGADLADVDRKAAPPGFLGQITDFRAWPYLGTENGPLVHGPGATAILDLARGYGGDGNSAVFACLTRRATAYQEAPLRVWRGDAESNDAEPIPDHPLEELWARPNPYLTGVEIAWWWDWAKAIDGNAYLRKVRSGDPLTGNVVQLWPISPTRIRPVTERGSGDFISYYLYKPTGNSNDDERIDPANIVHGRTGLDDRDLRLGCSGLKRLLREIASDDGATRFADALLRNYGIPGLLVTTPPDANLTREQAQELKQRIAGDFGSDNRGNVGVLSPGADMKQFGFTPEQLNLTVLHRIPEERIAAVIGVPPIIAGLGAGLDRATYSNYGEARQAFYEETILPLYAADGAKLTQQLLPDFTSDRALFAAFDVSRLRVLQEDEDAKHARVREDVKASILSVQEGRTALGYPAEIDPADVLLIPTTTTPTLAGSEVAAPPSSPRPALPAPGGKAFASKALPLEQFPALLAAIREVAEPSFEADLAAYWQDQRKRVKRRILGGP